MGRAPELRRRYADGLRRDGAITRPDVAAAFAAVPREAFVVDGFHGRDGGWITGDDEDFLESVYVNDVLITKMVDGTAVSSSSQPSLMAAMIEALDIEPGTRVLEVGAGTGYNAALMAALGAQVTSIDVQPDVLARARAGIARAGSAGVLLREGDGYLGYAGGGPYQRIVVTVGVTGVSPHWLDQLTPDGFVLAPVWHAGHHPVSRIRREADGRVGAAGFCTAGFMSAAGPLCAPYAGMHPPAAGPLPEPTVTRPARFDPPLDVFGYHDLWFAIGAWDRRVTFARLGEDRSGCVLLDESGAGGAVVAADGAVRASGDQAEAYAVQADALVDRWVTGGAPAVNAWRAEMALDGDPAAPIWVPKSWHLP